MYDIPPSKTRLFLIIHRAHALSAGRETDRLLLSSLLSLQIFAELVQVLEPPRWVSGLGGLTRVIVRVTMRVTMRA